ncbi:hypothetical protein [Haloglomus halophilum]|uniref:hypothetical protein n=1 Tax=Haloglomus halophilum TaxID=2962672 RepID=UPI0020C99934|nr:hypothetical protein [Haloglomus halophilum]
MDESSEGQSEDTVDPEATDEDVEAAINGVETAPDGSSAPQNDPDEPAASPDESAEPVAEGAPSPDSDPDPGDLPDEVINAPASAEDGEHTLLEDYERENEPRWKGAARKGAFWVGATAVAVAVTLTAVVSLRQSGLSDGVAFILASVGMAVMVGFVFLSLNR